MSIAVHSHWTFIADTSVGLFGYCDKVMQALLDVERCTPGFSDSAVSADAARSLVEIEATGSGADLSEAIATVATAVRAALHEVVVRG